MLPSCKVLVVEDREIDAELALYHLTHQGFTVQHASSAEEAIAMLRGSKKSDLPQVAVVDIGLPRMSGTDLIRGIKKEFPAILVTVSTGSTPAESHNELVEAGAMAILSKPFQDHHSQLLLGALREVSMAYQRGRHSRTDYWRYGLASGFVGGFASMVESSLALLIIAPEKFQLHGGLWLTIPTILVLAVLNGIKLAMAHLRQSPLPWLKPANGTNGHDDGQKGSDKRP